MSNLKLAIVLGFTFMFIAGLAVGRSPGGIPSLRAPKAEAQRSWLGNELRLTAPQQEQMKTIWSNPAITRPDLPKQFHDCDHQRDEAIQNLLSPEQKLQFEQIKRDHDAKVAALTADRNQAMRDAEDETRLMLSEDQRKKYDEILKAHGHHFLQRRPPVRRGGRPEADPSSSGHKDRDAHVAPDTKSL
jgi:hypothetical protein